MVKADLRTFPHFYSPKDSLKTPTLLKIIQKWNDKDLNLVSLTACHTKTSGIDFRWNDYLSELDFINDEFNIEDKRGEGWVKFTNKNKSKKPLILLNSQQVRTTYNNFPVDINILGVSHYIEPSKELDDTIKKAKDFGGIVTLCHIEDKCGLSLEDAIHYKSSGLADAIEIEAGKQKSQIDLKKSLSDKGIKPLPVTGGHNYKLAGTSYAVFNDSLLDDFSINLLSSYLNDNNFTPHFGKISRISQAWYRDRYILASFIGHILAGGKRAEEFKKATGLKKK